MKFSRQNFIRTTVLFFLSLLYIATIPARKVKYMTAHRAINKQPDKGIGRVGKKSGNDRVAVEPCNSYNPDKTFHALQKALQTIRFNPPRGKKVLLKPNIIGQNTPEQATTTHPGIVDALCRYFSDHGCSVTIGDSSAFYQGGGTLEGMETSGIAAVARKYGATLLPFETTRLRKITSGAYLNPFYLTEAVFSHDLVVNLPKLKIHRLARYTGAIKNMYGCIAGGSKQIYHKQFQHWDNYQELWGKPLVDVYEAIMPGLTVMDAVIGLDKDGPAGNGEPRFTGLLLASESGPALDIIACRIIGFDPEWVPAVREAVDRVLVSPEKVIVNGTVPSIPYVKLPDLKVATGIMGKADDYFFDQFIVSPVINRKKCTRCDDCIKGCAVKAISYDRERFPVVDFGSCIHCYCCESYCKQGAISLRGSAVNMLMRGVRQLLKL
jgi:uncharacterized protein (DUF362 family)/Pyruvate/2-oxoacid:ferredoxin oxidoreductase delta subunit